MRPPRSHLRNVIEYAAVLSALKSLEWAPLPLAYRLARGYTRLLDLALPRYRRIAASNLLLAWPELGPARRQEIIDGVFRSIARLLVTFAKFPSIHKDGLEHWIRPEGYEHFEEAVRSGRGVLFATAHLGNWELSAYAHAYFAGPMNVVVRPLDNPLLDRFVEHRRTLSGNRVLGKKDFARSILKALGQNEAVGVLIDQNAASEASVFVDFFGVPASAATSFARFAAHTGATVIPGFAVWSDAERRYILRLYPPVSMTGEIARDTQALHTRLEAVIRAHPEQWLWIHRRWKTRPPGQPPLYKSTPAHTDAL
ncbi:MAG: lipid A biosynthesis acyltransferase [Terriglobia bacterium]|nr:MAG: lipid A biosynthesis acyltransferase [Terriglobia bacterium]